MTSDAAQHPPPHWLIVGTPKSGTTTLAGWLATHPELCLANTKEVRYWNVYYDRGPQWYQEQFSKWRPGLLAGEATPSYMFSDPALDRIKATVPDVRLIAILRENVDRLWSHYWFGRSLGFETRSLERALKHDKVSPRLLPDGTPLGIYHASTYAPRIRAILERFPREQLLVLFMDDLRDNPDSLYAAATDHLGVSRAPHPQDEKARNYGRMIYSAHFMWLTWRPPLSWLPRRITRRMQLANVRQGVRYPKIEPELRAELRAHFADDRRELAEILGRPLPPAWQD
jgi:hypothetical protein